MLALTGAVMAVVFATQGWVAPAPTDSGQSTDVVTSGSASATIASITQPQAPADAPNVVVVLTDDMRADDLRYLPNVRRLLVDQGMTFTRAQSPHPLCCPARAEILSGQYEQNNGVHHNTGPYGGWQAFDPSSTIATWAQERGYATAIHGKHLNKFEGTTPDPGWNEFDILLEPVADYKDFRFFDGGRFRDDYVTTRLDERTVASIDSYAGRRPFMVFANHLAPHMWVPSSSKGDGDSETGGVLPPAAPEHKRALRNVKPRAFRSPSFNEKDISDKETLVRGRAKVNPERMRKLNRARLRALLSVDDAVAHLVAGLRSTDQLDNTYIVFTSDNGYALGEHRYEGKDKLSTEILSVPLVVRGPDVPAGTASRRIVSLVDLTATLVDLMGLTPTRTIDGASFADALRDPKSPGVRDTMLIQTGSKETGVRFPGFSYRGVLTQRYAYARRVNSGPGVGFLYDHHADPHELRNLIRSRRYEPVRRELERRYRLLADCAGMACNRDFGPLPRPLPSRG